MGGGGVSLRQMSLPPFRSALVGPAATTAYRGGVGTTTLKISVQTATQDNPIHESGFTSKRCRNSAAAMP